MTSLSREQTECRIVERLERDELDFVAYVTTQWVSLGVQAALATMAKQTGHLRGIIFICTFEGGRCLVQKDDLLLPENCEAEILIYDRYARSAGGGGRKLLLLQNFSSFFFGRRRERDLILIEPLYPRLTHFVWLHSRFQRSIRYWIIDEGFLSYGSIFLNLVILHFEQPDVSLLSKLKSACARIFQAGCVCLLEYKKAVRWFFLFQRKEGETFLERDIARKYRGLLERKRLAPPVKPEKRRLLVITQPYLQHCDPDEIAAILLRLRQICERYDIGFDLKLHPREAKDGLPARYRAQEGAILHVRKNVEELLADGGYAGVAGWSSTSLLTSEALYSVPAFSVLRLSPEAPRHVFVRQLDGEFSKFSKDVIAFPDSWSALDLLIKGLPWPGSEMNSVHSAQTDR